MKNPDEVTYEDTPDNENSMMMELPEDKPKKSSKVKVDETEDSSDLPEVPEGVDEEALTEYVDGLDKDSQKMLLDILQDKMGVDHKDEFNDHDEDNG